MAVEPTLEDWANDGEDDRWEEGADDDLDEGLAEVTHYEEATPGCDAAAPGDHLELRALITSWAATAESPYRHVLVRKLGNRVGIADVVRTPLASIEFRAQTTELQRTAFEVPASEPADLRPLAPSLEFALPLLPPFALPSDRTETEGFEVEEDVDHLAWAETVVCPACSSGRVTCVTCAGAGTLACSCGSGTVAETVEETATCPACSGSGKTEARVCIPCGGKGSSQCSSCWGTRRRADRQPCDRCIDGTTVCAHCGGTGEVFGRCLKCAGAGALPMQNVRHMPCPVCAGMAKVACADCYAGRRPCERCKATGSLVRGERVRRVMRVGPQHSLASDVLIAVHPDPFTAAVPFVASDRDAVGAIAARLVDTPAIAKGFLEIAREAIGAGATVVGRYGSVEVVAFTARLGIWCAEFTVLEAGADRSIDCTSGMQPPVDPKAYGRWMHRENAARAAAYEEAAVSAESIYVAAMEQYRRELAASAPAPSPTPKPADVHAATSETRADLRWSEDDDLPGDSSDDDPPANEPKERRGRFAVRGIGPGRRDRDAAAHDGTDADDSAASRLASTEPAPTATSAPAIPAPVRRDVPPPELLPAYGELPPEVRVS